MARAGRAQKRAGAALAGAAVLLAAAALSANRFAEGAREFNDTQQITLIVAVVCVVVAVRLISASWEATLVAAIVGAFVISRVPTLDAIISEAHGFRQTQTAYVALSFSATGIDLFHPGPAVLGPPFEIPFEFPLFQALAVVPLKLQLPPDTAVRLTGLACFVATALLLYGFLRHVAGTPVAVAGLAAFVVSPFALLWGKTAMIEYLATAGAVGWAWMTIRWREDRRPVYAALALAAGSVALLVKPSTGIFWVLPALAWRPAGAGTTRQWARSLASPVLIAIIAVPVALAAAWTLHADAVKAGHEATAWLTSDRLRTWYLGTFDQRLELDEWTTIWNRFSDWVTGLALVLLPVSAYAAWRSGQRLFWLAIAACVLLPPLVFFNLYAIHDYYQAAITPAVAALVGLGGGWLWTVLRTSGARVALVGGAAILAAWTLQMTSSYWRAEADPAGGLPHVAKALKRATTPDELAMVAGVGWSPEVLYYARRRGLALDEGFYPPSFLHKQRDRYHLLASASPTTDRIPKLLNQWPWIGVVARTVYGMGETPAQIPGAVVSATGDLEALAAARRSGVLLSAESRSIPCDSTTPTRLPAGARGTWLRIEGPPGALIEVGDLFATPIPARPVLVIAPGGSKVGLNCTGAPAVTVAETVDAPPPVRCRPPRPFRWAGCGRLP